MRNKNREYLPLEENTKQLGLPRLSDDIVYESIHFRHIFTHITDIKINTLGENFKKTSK